MHGVFQCLACINPFNSHLWYRYFVVPVLQRRKQRHRVLSNFPKVSQLVKPLHSFRHPWVVSIPSVPKAHLGWGRSQGFWLLRFFIPKWKQFLTQDLTLRLCILSTLHRAGFVLNKDPSSVESSFFVILLMLLPTCEWLFRVNKILFTNCLTSFENSHMEPLLRGLQN